MTAIPKPFVLISDVDSLMDTKFKRQVETCVDAIGRDYLKDYEVFLLFIKQYAFSQDTYNSYRRDVERFLLWLWLVRKASLQQLDAETLLIYLHFFKNPPKSWQQQSRQVRIKKGFINSLWRPFMGGDKTPSQHSIKAMLAILRTFFQFCIDQDYIQKNPVAQMKQKRQHISQSQENTVLRRMNNRQWQTIIEIAIKEKNKSLESHRALFVLSLFYLLGVRISEISSTLRHTPTMGDFYLDADQQWWFKALGKGNKQRDIAVADSLLDILSDYRHMLGLSKFPVLNESTPLIPKLKGQGGCGIRQVRNILSLQFDKAVNELITSGYPQLAEHLQSATAHWLRHTSISDDVGQRPLEHVRDDAGHSNIRITSHYITTDRSQRYLSAKEKKLIKED